MIWALGLLFVNSCANGRVEAPSDTSAPGATTAGEPSSAPRVAERPDVVAAPAAPLASTPTSTAPKPTNKTALPTAAIVLDVAVPKDPACSFRTTSWKPKSSNTILRVRDGGPAFAHVDEGEGEIWLPPGSGHGGILEFRAGGLRVRGFVASSDIVLRPATTFLLSGVAATKPETRLEWHDGTNGNLTVRASMPSQLKLKGGELEATRPCGELSLEETAFDPIASLMGKKPGALMWMEGKRVPLSMTAISESVATLTPPWGLTSVTVFETQGERSRIAWDLRSVFAVGWVNKTTLRSRRGGTTTSRSGLRGSTSCTPPTPIARYYCDTDIVLRADVKGDVFSIGVIEEGTTIEVIGRGTEDVRVAFQTSELYAAQDTRFLVRNTDLAPCHEALPKIPPKETITSEDSAPAATKP